MAQTLHLPYHPNRLQKLMQRLFALKPVSAVLAPIAHHLDAPFIRLSQGRVTLTSLLTGLPVVTLTTVGARSGQPRRVPLVAIPMDGGETSRSESEGEGIYPEVRGTGPEVRGKVILIASNFGRRRHPAWYYNLRLNPHATLSANAGSGRYLAHETAGAEREACWQMAALAYSGYNAYRQRASHRDIAVFVLEPLDSPA